VNMDRPKVAPEVYAILSALVEERCGLHYAAIDASILAEKIAARADEAGFHSLLDYYYFLRYDDESGAETAALVDALVVNETYLYREAAQLDAVVAHYVAPAVRANGRARIWCAACATGEEAFTLAMLLADHDLLDQTEIIASDVSDRALARARSGFVAPRSLERAARPADAARGVERGPHGAHVAPRIRAAIDFRKLNLIDVEEIAKLGAFDVVLARNVFIYFRDDTIRRVVDAIAGTLRPGGALFVGVSESLLRFGVSLACVEHGGVFAYRKEAR
jgi:chemotaxis protein methyltransferase CheR